MYRLGQVARVKLEDYSWVSTLFIGSLVEVYFILKMTLDFNGYELTYPCSLVLGTTLVSPGKCFTLVGSLGYDTFEGHIRVVTPIRRLSSVQLDRHNSRC